MRQPAGRAARRRAEPREVSLWLKSGAADANAFNGHALQDYLLECLALCLLHKVEELVNVRDLVRVEAEAGEQLVTAAKRQRVRHDAKLQRQRIVQFQDHVIQILQYGERRNQTRIVAVTGPGEQIRV